MVEQGRTNARICPSFIGGTLMEWTEYAKIIVEKCKKSRTPSNASFELTPYCNFNCNMCYIRLTPEQAQKQGSLLTTDQWIFIANEAKKLGTIGMEITGGEATTRSDFPILYETFVKMGYIISLRSNGYLLCGDLLELLKKFKPRYVSITLYGGTDDTYRKVCGVEDGFTVVTNNILALREAGITVDLTVTMTNDNINDRDLLKKWASDNGFGLAFYGGLITPIRSAKRSIKHLKVSHMVTDAGANIDISRRVVKDREKYMHPFWMCGEYGTRYCISWDGRMTLCNCFPAIWSDPFSQSFGDAFRSLYEQLDMIRRPSNCATCQVIDYCGVCPVRFMSETGSYETTCESLCNTAVINYKRSHGLSTKRQILDKDTISLAINERNG